MARSIDTKGAQVMEPQSTALKPLVAGEYAVSVYDVKVFQYKADSAGEGRDEYNVQLRVMDGQEGANRRLFDGIGLFPKWGATANPDGSDNFAFFDFFAAIRGIPSDQYRAGVRALLLDKKSPTYAEDLEKALKVIKDKGYLAEIEAGVKAGSSPEVPDVKELIGKKLNIVVKIIPDEYAYNRAKGDGTLGSQTQQDFLKNQITSRKPFAEVSETKAAPQDAFVL